MPKEETVRASVVCDAIRKRALLEFRYDGLRRMVQPYCHGVSTRGVEVLRAVQIGGSSRAGGFGFGKLWTVAKIVDARVTSETFVPDDPDYNSQDRGMSHVHCRV